MALGKEVNERRGGQDDDQEADAVGQPLAHHVGHVGHLLDGPCAVAVGDTDDEEENEQLADDARQERRLGNDVSVVSPEERALRQNVVEEQGHNDYQSDEGVPKTSVLVRCDPVLGQVLIVLDRRVIAQDADGELLGDERGRQRENNRGSHQEVPVHQGMHRRVDGENGRGHGRLGNAGKQSVSSGNEEVGGEPAAACGKPCGNADPRVAAQRLEDGAADGRGENNARVAGQVGVNADNSQRGGDRPRRGAQNGLAHERGDQPGLLEQGDAQRHGHNQPEGRKARVNRHEVGEVLSQRLVAEKVHHRDSRFLGIGARLAGGHVGDRNAGLGQKVRQDENNN